MADRLGELAARPRLAAAAPPGRLGARLTTALFRSVYSGRVRWAMPHVLVEETPELAVLYTPPGTVGRKPRRRFIEDPTQLRTLRWGHVDHVWTGSHALRLLRPAAAHCLYLFWSELDWAFQGWYVNLQERFRRTAASFDTRDHALDVVVEPDGSWRWKDEDHLELAVAAGAFTPEEAAEIRAEGIGYRRLAVPDRVGAVAPRAGVAPSPASIRLGSHGIVDNA